MSSQDAIAECYQKPPLRLDETDVIPNIVDLTKKGKLDWRKMNSGYDGINYYHTYRYTCEHNGVKISIAPDGILLLDKYKFYDAMLILNILNEEFDTSEKVRAYKLINQFFTGLI